ncbi:ATP-NAD kinase-like domain-containing protein [Jimgerdemannia flammicorona]|uniref:ATP-NAD kinase-like domain-containing protein n=1 Tax=Jimgerdemannia flammicorona TaxID=994334 RepID=A0A433QAG9_9FUNG|nr:ATP-NAD kinase-like domain-containing protein [Jimgerdemannia flammicorona]
MAPSNLTTEHPSLSQHSAFTYLEPGTDSSPSVGLCKTTTTLLADTAVAVRDVSKRIAHAHIKWESPRTALIVTKPGDKNLVKLTHELAEWLIETPRYGNPSGLTVYVDAKLQNSKRFRYKREGKLKFWTPELCATQPHLFDFVITLGGDGTVLFTSWLFQGVVPPVVPFHLGSLGFLTPFDFSNFKEELTAAIEHGVRINLRMRFSCTVYRAVRAPDCNPALPTTPAGLRSVKKNRRTGEIRVGDWVDGEGDMHRTRRMKEAAQETGSEGQDEHGSWAQEKHVPCFTTVPTESFEVLNDLVVDRGPSPYMSLLELFGDNQHLTTVQADGLAIATPTGSTAYSLSAGGPLTHPEIPAILISPICPHTLSFRPMLLPNSMELRVCVPMGSRATAWASFDGRGRIELRQGDHIKITASRHPFPTICAQTASKDWFNSLTRCLRWNERQQQKMFVVVESRKGRTESKRKAAHDRQGSTVSAASSVSSDPEEGVFAMFGNGSETGRTGSEVNSFEEEEYDDVEDEEEDEEEDEKEDEDEEDDTLEGWGEDELRKVRLTVPKAPQALIADSKNAVML